MKKITQYSVPQVAAILKVSRQAVSSYIKRGLLKATKVGRNYVINKRDLDKFIASRKKV